MQISHSLGTQLVMLVLNMTFGILLARSLGPAGKGGYDLLVNTNLLLMTVLGLSLPAGVTYVVAGARVHGRWMFRWLIAAALGQGLCAGVLLLGAQWAGALTVLLPSSPLPLLLLFACCYLGLTTSAGYWRAVLLGRQNIIAINWVTMLTRVLDLVLLCGAMLLAIRHGSTVRLEWLMLILILSAGVGNVLLWSQARTTQDVGAGTDSGLHRVVRFALPIHAGNVAQFLNYRLDIFLLSYFLDQRAVGLYTLAVSTAQLVWLLPSSASVLLLPKVAADHARAAPSAALTSQMTRLFAWASLAGGAALGGLGVFAIPMVYGPAFAPSVLPFLALLPGAILIAPAFLLASHIAGIGRPAVNSCISILALFVTVAMNLLLIPRLGITGAALASTASYAVTAIALFCAYGYLSGASLRDLLLVTAEDGRDLLARFRRLGRHGTNGT